jgi:hypothetical protein
MAALSIGVAPDQVRTLFPGVLACGVVAAASTFLSEHYGAPVMLFALLLGLAMNFLSGEGACKPGIEFTARNLLRIGVALLGLRITIGQIAEVGWQPMVIIVLTVALTIAVSMLAARLLGFQTLFGLLSGGATAICGASAAMALAREMGLVKLGTIGVDGTKVKANASRHKAMSYAHMLKAEAEFKAQIEALLNKARAAETPRSAQPRSRSLMEQPAASLSDCNVSETVSAKPVVKGRNVAPRLFSHAAQRQTSHR